MYIFVPTLAGRATDALGAKWIAFTGTLGPCLLSAITPIATSKLDVGALIAIRTLMGAFHGFIYPALFSLYVKWFPVKERANANAAMVFGGALGSALMNLLSGYLAETSLGWPLIFYVASSMHIPWLILWVWIASDDPQSNKIISKSELKFITDNVPRTQFSVSLPIPIFQVNFKFPL